LQSPAGATANTLARAQALYDAAAYEEVLSLLVAAEGGGSAERVEEFRALSLLALGRTADAERALERIVRRTPLHAIDAAEVSPKLVVLFKEVRERLLPAVARNLYARATANFDNGQYPVASVQLQELVTLLSTVEPAVADANEMLELRARAESFLVASRKVYEAGDRTVAGPIEISRVVPTWVDVGPQDRTGLYQGVIEVIIDETGRVRSAVMRRSITSAYDASLLAATRTWRFEPASFNGAPVSYKKLFEIIVRSR
jgi:TonB family protein